MTPDIVLMLAGVFLVGAAIIGGGMSTSGVNVPVITSIARQVLLGLLGAAVFGLGYYYYEKESGASSDVAAESVSESASEAAPEAASEAVSEAASEAEPSAAPASQASE